MIAATAVSVVAKLNIVEFLAVYTADLYCGRALSCTFASYRGPVVLLRRIKRRAGNPRHRPPPQVNWRRLEPSDPGRERGEANQAGKA